MHSNNPASQGAQTGQTAQQSQKPTTEQQKKRVHSETIVLGEPLHVDGETIEKLEMRRATARDMLQAQEAAESQMGQEVQLFAYMTGKNPEVLLGLDLADYRKLQDVFSRFLSE